MMRRLWVGWLVAWLTGCGEPAARPPGTGAAGAQAGGGAAAGAVSAGSGGLNAQGGASASGAAGGGASASGGTAADCDPLSASLLCAPLSPMPPSLAETGLFPAAPDFSQRSPRLLEYVPDPALWSDGMDKQRFLLLPAGTRIDNSNRARWSFPAGTLLVKTFFDDSGPGGAPRPIETRLIRAIGAERYQFFVYQWLADGSDAILLVDDIEGDPNAGVRVPVTIDRTIEGARFAINGGQPFEHTLPSRNACGECHEANAAVAQTIIGFDELRLGSKRAPTDGMTQLEAFAAAGLFTSPPPAAPAAIVDASDDGGRLLRIKRFVFGNCVSCHNGESVVDLRPDVFVENTVGEPTEAQSVRPPEGWLRVVPGDPARSVLYVQLERVNLPEPALGGNRLRPMPPIGLADAAVEPTSLKDTFDWISALVPDD